MSNPLILRVRSALAGIDNPKTGRNIIADGMIHGLGADDEGRVRFTLVFDESADREEAEVLLTQAKKAAGALEGVSAVTAVATAHGSAKPSQGRHSPVSQQSRHSPSSQQSRHSPQATASAHENPFGLKNKPRVEAAAETLSGVKSIIAVASGKGGVGKSTVAANLAVALAASGLQTGLLDADIYGPSAPTLFGIKDKPAMKDGKIQPREAYGVKIMSIGMLIDPEQAIAWRGPMVMGAVRQLMSDVDWGDLDVMIIDTPPGTGDTHLSLIQSKRLTGAVIVSTPQEMALADMRRGVSLFRQTETPVIGVIENMAWLELPGGERQYLFGEGGAKKAAETIGAPFLGAIPLYPELRQASDDGLPLAARDHPGADVFKDLAAQISKAARSH
ncbi:Mrp/NBP35 family ATP-binding protein [Hyphococcus flavus]|uniref:Iron-sulfur cluster carrier protein n=1 Tax=Hyphococcus flavus TaxID=1866326 RepID=A0AAE9ZC71_9PROT|nr:Mrp/NBP35 family ATP-binding protein [Hyphococcus flavus]WDI32064.1 Mrp/NBP35 family ATP-binding protein [Hyphococcus flavus]